VGGRKLEHPHHTENIMGGGDSREKGFISNRDPHSHNLLKNGEIEGRDCGESNQEKTSLACLGCATRRGEATSSHGLKLPERNAYRGKKYI